MTSIFIFSSNTIVEPEIIPPMLPIKIASDGFTYAQEAVIDTKPAKGPEIINIGSGFFITIIPMMLEKIKPEEADKNVL